MMTAIAAIILLFMERFSFFGLRCYRSSFFVKRARIRPHFTDRY
jgi:hypothetical protein